MASAAEVIARRLAGACCSHAFGMPGGETLAMMEALSAAGLRFVLTKHENSAGFMAEGVYHATGAPGVLLATIGPGVANAVNVVANAEQDRVPLIFLTGCVDADVAHGYTHQVFDHGALLSPVTRASFRAAEGAVDVIVDKALALACDAPPGPVHIDIPISLARRDEPQTASARRGQPIAGGPPPGPALEEARAKLARAERPLVVAGLEALGLGEQDSAAGDVASFCRDLSIPLITTYKAKGILPEDDALALGGAGLSPEADKVLLPLMAQADLIVAAGYDPIEMRTGWCNPWDPDKVIEFTTRANQHYVHQAGQSFVGDIAAGLAALRTDGTAPAASWPGGEASAAREKLRSFFSSDGTWGPAQAIEVARAALPRETVATVDSGAHRILLSQMWDCYHPRGLLQSTGLCTMGCALPLAMGYKLARPQTPVVAFTGDAGLEMVLGELATLRDLALPVIVVVFVDASLALIELKQRRDQLPNLGVDFGRTDFPAVARALGGHGASVRDAETLQAELAAAQERPGFTIIACEINRKSYDGTF